MRKEVVSTTKAPAKSGSLYSPALRIGQFVFISGQIADDAKAGIQTQTRQALQKMRKLVKAAGTNMDNVVKCTIYLTDLGDYALMNDIYREFFPTTPPARACVEVSGLVKGFKVEIEAIAFVP